MGLFDRWKKKPVPTAPFDSDAFLRRYRAHIMPRLPEKIDDADAQKRLCEALKQAIPQIDPKGHIDDVIAKMRTGAQEPGECIGQAAVLTDRALREIDVDALAPRWSTLAEPRLIDAYILLDIYGHTLKGDAVSRLLAVRDKLGIHLQSRLTEAPYKAEPKPQSTAPTTTQKRRGYRGVYETNVDYGMQHLPEREMYMIEIHDAAGKYLADVDWHSGLIGFAGFLLSEEEYELANTPTAGLVNPAVNELVKKLLDNLPKDRLLSLGYINQATGKLEKIRLEPKVDSMDDGACVKQRAARLADYIRSLDKVYVMYTRSMGERFPAVDGHGFAWVFSKPEYAQALQKKNPDVDLLYRELTQDAFQDFVRSWYPLGVTRFQMNLAAGDHSFEMDRDAFAPMDGIRQWDLFGSALNQLTLRFKQNLAIKTPDTQAAAMTMWNLICHELYEPVFLVPVSYDDEPDDAEDWAIHFTDTAAKRLTQLELTRLLHTKLPDDRTISLHDKDNQQVYAINKAFLYGSEPYHFPEARQSARVMHLRTLIGNGVTHLCGFTDFKALQAIFGTRVHVGVFTYEEIIAHLDDELSDGNTIHGLVINPGYTSLILSRKDIEAARAAKDEPRKIFVHDDKAT